MNRTTRWTLGLPLVLFASVGMASEANAALEAKVKAAYLYNFTKFVDWPSLPEDTLTICVVDSDAVKKSLNEISNRKVKGHFLKIRQGRPENPANCQILFIGKSEGDMADLLKRFHEAGVLTVSDTEDFASRGGIIGFYSEGERVKLQINPRAAREANLRISSKLMEVSHIVP